MPDTRRSKSALQTLHADNTAGDISAQDNRDGWESCHPESVSQTAAFASEPSSGQLTGDLFFPNNSFYVERYSGSAWVPWGPIYPMTKPVDGDFSWTNQGTSTAVTTNGGIAFTVDQDASANMRIRRKTAPSVPFTITACFLANMRAGATHSFGLCFREATSGLIETAGLTSASASISGFRLNSQRWNSATSYNSDNTVTTNDAIVCFPVFIRIADNSTNRIFSYSFDGINFSQIYSTARATWLTSWATLSERQVGFYGFADGSTPDFTATLLSWKEE